MLPTALAATSESSFSDVERITLWVVAATAVGVTLAGAWMRRTLRPRFATWVSTISPSALLAGVLLTIVVAAVSDNRYEAATRTIGCGLGLLAGAITAWLLTYNTTRAAFGDPPPGAVPHGTASPGSAATGTQLIGDHHTAELAEMLPHRPRRAASGLVCASLGPIVAAIVMLAVFADGAAATATPSVALGVVVAVLTLLRTADAAVVAGLAGGVAASVLAGDVAWGSIGVLFALLTTVGVVLAVLLAAVIAAGHRQQSQSTHRRVAALIIGVVTAASCTVLAAQACLPTTFVHLIGVTADPLTVAAAATTAGVVAGAGVLLAFGHSPISRGVVAHRRRTWQFGAGLAVILAVAQATSQGAMEVSFIALACAGAGVLAAVALGVVVFAAVPTSQSSQVRRSLGPIAVAALGLQGAAVAASVVLDGVNEAGVSLFGFPALFAVAAPSVLLGLVAGLLAPDAATRWRRPGGVAEPSAMVVVAVAIVAVVGILAGFGAAIGCAVGVLLRAVTMVTQGAWRRPRSRVPERATVLAVVMVAIWHVAHVSVLLHGPFGAGLASRMGWAIAVLAFSVAILCWWPGKAMSPIDLTETAASTDRADSTESRDSTEQGVSTQQHDHTELRDSVGQRSSADLVDVTDQVEVTGQAEKTNRQGSTPVTVDVSEGSSAEPVAATTSIAETAGAETGGTGADDAAVGSTGDSKAASGQSESVTAAASDRTVDVTDAATTRSASTQSATVQPATTRSVTTQAASTPRPAEVPQSAVAAPEANATQASRPAVQTGHIITEPQLHVDVDHDLGVHITPDAAEPSGSDAGTGDGGRSTSPQGAGGPAADDAAENDSDRSPVDGSTEDNAEADDAPQERMANQPEKQVAPQPDVPVAESFLADDSAEHHGLLLVAARRARALAIRRDALAAGRAAAGLDAAWPPPISQASIEESTRQTAQIGDAADLMTSPEAFARNVTQAKPAAGATPGSPAGPSAAIDMAHATSTDSITDSTTGSTPQTDPIAAASTTDSASTGSSPSSASPTPKDGHQMSPKSTRQESTPEISIENGIEITTDTVSVVATSVDSPADSESSLAESTEPVAKPGAAITVEHGAVVTVEDSVDDEPSAATRTATAQPAPGTSINAPETPTTDNDMVATDHAVDDADQVDVTDSETLLRGFSSGVVNLLPETTDASGKSQDPRFP